MKIIFLFTVLFCLSCQTRVKEKVAKLDERNNLISLDSFNSIRNAFCVRASDVYSVTLDSLLFNQFGMIQNTIWEYHCYEEIEHSCFDSSVPVVNYLKTCFRVRLQRSGDSAIFVKDYSIDFPSFGKTNSFYQIKGLKICNDSLKRY